MRLFSNPELPTIFATHYERIEQRVYSHYITSIRKTKKTGESRVFRRKIQREAMKWHLLISN